MGNVKSAERVLDILVLLAGNREGMTFTAICEQLGWPKSSTYALLTTLQDRGFLDLDGQFRRYSIGVKAWEVGQSYLLGENLAKGALPYMHRLCESLNETVQLAILDGRDNVYIAKVDAAQSLALASHVGARLPAHVTAVGKALLAGLADAELDQLYSGADFVNYTPATISSLYELKQDLRRVRSEGYGRDDGEYTRGVYCLAVPILGEAGRTVAAMSVSVPRVRLTEDLERRMLDGLRKRASEISARLGYTPPNERPAAVEGGAV